MSDESERVARAQRMVADKVTDRMLTAPVGDLTDAEVAVLKAALGGPHGDELMRRADALLGEPT